MTRITKLVILALFVLLGGGYFLIGPTFEPVTPTASAFGPAEIYAAHCAKCHGADGRAKTAKGKRVGATDFTSDWNTDAEKTGTLSLLTYARTIYEHSQK